MKNKKIKIILVIGIIAIIAIILFIFLIKPYKTVKIGNTITKSAEEIENYILNISSYELTAQITVNSNKNQNKYIVKQKYTKQDEVFKQEVLEPENIKGLTTTYDGKNLTIENTNLGLTSFYENYSFIGDNSLCLNDFIENYKNNNHEIYEEEKLVKFEIENDKGIKILSVNKQTGLPSQMVIQDRNKNTIAYIEYTEIEVNGIPKEEVLAFKMEKKTTKI